MKIVSFYKPLPISDPNSFVDVTTEQPRPGARDLLVEVQAISVNPVDAKVRSGGGPGRPDGQLQILGWDAAGVVKERGSEVTQFGVGEEVYYAGSVDRAGSYGQFQCVDERIVGRKPKTIGFAEAAALPLTTIRSEKPPISGQRSIICTDSTASTIRAGPIHMITESETTS